MKIFIEEFPRDKLLTKAMVKRNLPSVYPVLSLYFQCVFSVTELLQSRNRVETESKQSASETNLYQIFIGF